MKKIYLFTLMICLSVFGMAQSSIFIRGSVFDENDEPAENVDVYIANAGNTGEHGDTLGVTQTGDDGNFSLTVIAESDSILLVATSSICPEIPFVVFVAGGPAFVQIECSQGEEPSPEFLFLGATPLNAEGDEWNFFPSVFGEPVAYNWTIDGNNFSTPDVTYFFGEPGTYSVSLSVDMASGNVLTDERLISVVETPNCEALFFPFADSLSEDGLVFVNNSIGDNLSYFWDFGDGNTSTEPYPTHEFEEFLSYEICLTITGEDCNDTYCLELDSTDVGGWSGLMAGSQKHPLKGSSEAKDGSAFEFIVVPPSVNPLSVRGADLDVELSMYPNPSDGNAF